jgi:hypothetical protein
VLVGVDIGHAHVGIVWRHRRQERESKFDPFEDGSLVMPMVVTIRIQILYQFSRFAMDSEGEFVVLVPR